MEMHHNLHGHFTDQITMKRCLGKFYWPTRDKDIYEYCRSCPNCQMIGHLRPTTGLLPVVSLQVGDILALDYIGPVTPIAKSGTRFIGICVDYFARFLFADATAQATSANSVAILESKVVKRLDIPEHFTPITEAIPRSISRRTQRRKESNSSSLRLHIRNL